MLRRSISKSEKFYFKDEIIYSDNSAIIRAREKRQAVLQNVNTAKYEKIKTNDRSAKKNLLKKLYEDETFNEMSIDEQKTVKILKLKKLFQRRFNEKKSDKHLIINYHITLSY